MSTSIKKRVFVIGAPRSGTTLLQSLLASHSQINSFPETFFFNYLFSDKPLLNLLGIASPHIREYWEKFLSIVGTDKNRYKLSPFTIFSKQYTRQFVEVLDDLTIRQNKRIWVEKTPNHLLYIPHLEREIKDVAFIHILRRGPDVIASLYEISKKYETGWSKELSSLDRCIEIWDRDIHISLNYTHKKNHVLVKYDDLTENPHETIVRLCDFLEIPFEDQMIDNYSRTASKLIRNEPWKESVNAPIKPLIGHKFKTLFTPQEQRYILDHLPQDIDYDQITV